MGSLGAVRTDAYGYRFSGGQTLAYGFRDCNCGVSCESSRRSELRRERKRQQAAALPKRPSAAKRQHRQSGLETQRRKYS